jgi:hypothetical protein
LKHTLITYIHTIMKVVLVCTGVFQEYILHNIKNLILHGNTDITLITELMFFPMIQEHPEFRDVKLVATSDLSSEMIKHFDQTSTLDRVFRGGFWYHCSSRFFYIYEYMKKNNIKDIVHIENDTMVYTNLDTLKDGFTVDKVYAPFDTFTRVIPSFVFIPSHHALKPIIDKYDGTKTDMDNLASIEHVEPLPIISVEDNLHFFNKHFAAFEALFDAAAFGQYVGGIDKRNDPNDTRGFVNETCFFKYDRYPFYWIRDKKNNLWCPWIEIGGKLVKIVNLHLHGKMLHEFMSDNPIECQYIKILS